MKKLFLLSILLCGTLSLTAQNEPYKNPQLSPEERAADLTSRLTLEEKVALMQNTSPAVERLGIKPYNWWNEALHGVARAGEATVFPQTIGMAASFDPDLLYKVFDAVSDEARAKFHDFQRKGRYGKYQCLTFWTPNVNIFRDPRWGRGQETYGEDPYLTSVLGLQVIRGLQGPADTQYDKLHACAKHFAVHSGPEWNRHSFNAENIDLRDLYETYLPAFKTAVIDGDVKEVMCAYNRFEGKPCCGSDRLLMQILRDEWKFKYLVVSDCGAINDFYNRSKHHTHPDSASASADAVLAGTDVECGGSYKSLVDAVKKGYIKESDIDVSVRRLLAARFALGEMDDEKLVEWSKIPYSVVDCPEHRALALEMAKESIVLGVWFGTSSVTELPVKTSDLVYPALIQRCGMVFALLVFIVFIMMWLEGVQLFVRKQDRYHRAVGAGFVFMLFDQTLIIIAGSTGLCPLTGITLPFISSGGSSLMISFMIVGLIVAVSSNVKWKGTLEDEEEQDKFFKENAVTAKCHTYLRHLNDHFPRKSFRAAAGRVRRSGQKEESGGGKGG